MKASLIISCALFFFCTSCVAPVNLVHDNASMLDVGKWKVAASAAQYYSGGGDSKLNTNFGIMAFYGVAERTTLHGRFERLTNTGGFLDLSDGWSAGAGINYAEIGAKFGLIEDRLALDLAMSSYSNTGDHVLVLDPRLIFTTRFNQNVELSAIGKAHIFMSQLGAFPVPAVSLGLGLSTDLDRWAIRPEVGVDGYLSWGIGVEFHIGR